MIVPALLAAAALSACGASNPTTPNTAASGTNCTTMYDVKATFVPNLFTWAPAWMGTPENLDTFRQACVNLTIVDSSIGQSGVAVMLAGQADVTATNSASVINAYGTSDAQTILAQAETNDNLIMIRSGLTNTGSPSDLVGKKIGYVGAIQQGIIATKLATIGKSLSDVTLVQITAANTVASLQSGQIDFATVSAPLDVQIKSAGIGTTWNDPRDGKDPLSDLPYGVFFSRTSWATNNPDAAKAFIKGVCLTSKAMRADPENAATVALKRMSGDATANKAAVLAEVPNMNCTIAQDGWDKLGNVLVAGKGITAKLDFSKAIWSEAPAVWAANAK